MMSLLFVADKTIDSVYSSRDAQRYADKNCRCPWNGEKCDISTPLSFLP